MNKEEEENIDATEEQIQAKLNDIMGLIDEKIDEELPKIIRLFSKIIYNVRFDLDELKIKLYETLLGEEDVDYTSEELKFPDKLPKKPERMQNDLYS